MYGSCALHACNDFMFMLSPYLCSLVTFLHHMLSVRAYRHYIQVYGILLGLYSHVVLVTYVSFLS